MYIIGSATMGIFGFVYFGMIDTGSSTLIFIAMVLSLIPHDMQYGPQAALIAESFTPQAALQRRFDLLPARFDHRGRARAADRDGAVRHLQIRHAYRDLHPDHRDHLDHRDRVPEGLYGQGRLRRIRRLRTGQ